ncbi:carbohydrate ABC transporter permease [Lacisediminihabitans profunda]|uniref:Sugar ABC transporter permease n=1 Tax=Lacisediminihabitans profunda TaxID=2594790 RepID=A0A5C8UWC7_9MICO|nr:sugar ABC transporter permease [Lacisediminihabitans profunda]TXN32343.1 sugar ABC transporter permease [Lacisediminihabitans profunda]
MTTTIEVPTATQVHRATQAGIAHKKKARASRALVLPALVFSVILTQVPFLVTIYFSLLNWNQLRPSEIKFAWFKNYAVVFTGPDFLPSLFATVVITGSSVILSLLLGLFFAVLLDRKFVGRGLARTLMITPFLVMPAAAALIWKWSLLDVNVGMVNWALHLVGLSAIAWNTDLPVVTIIMMLTWQYTPFMMLILLAGLQSQSREVLEAASVDGAGPWRTFQWMTLPHLRQYIEIATLLGSIMLLQAFDPIAIMTKGTGGTKTLSYLLYERAFIGLDVGQAAAFGVVTVAVTIGVATIALRTLFKVFINGGER